MTRSSFTIAEPLAFCLLLLFSACLGIKPGQHGDPLNAVLQAAKKDTLMHKIISHPDEYELQIIYTRIDRDAQNIPHFTRYYWHVDSNRYFYPASTVKLPLALLSLEKINNIRKSGYPRINRNSYYLLDSVRPFQQTYHTDPGAPGGKPSIAHDIRQVLTVSDNLAYNHLFEFLGREYINETLHAKSYTHTGIIHRFNFPGRENQYASPMVFFDQSGGILKEGEKTDRNVWKNPQKTLLKGQGYLDEKDSLIRRPFDFSRKNWFAITDMDNMLKATLFPEATPPEMRFDLTAEDYRFIWHYMGIFPRECDYPNYDTSYYDGFVKFLLPVSSKKQQDGRIRVFNKIGEAYGTLTDIAYIVDFENKVEFMLTATILCNSDGIFNDDRYDYDQIGLPFLAWLSSAVYDMEKRRKRPVQPDLSKFEAAVK